LAGIGDGRRRIQDTNAGEPLLGVPDLSIHDRDHRWGRSSPFRERIAVQTPVVGVEAGKHLQALVRVPQLAFTIEGHSERPAACRQRPGGQAVVTDPQAEQAAIDPVAQPQVTCAADDVGALSPIREGVGAEFVFGRCRLEAVEVRRVGGRDPQSPAVIQGCPVEAVCARHLPAGDPGELGGGPAHAIAGAIRPPQVRAVVARIAGAAPYRVDLDGVANRIEPPHLPRAVIADPQPPLGIGVDLSSRAQVTQPGFANFQVRACGIGEGQPCREACQHEE